MSIVSVKSEGRPVFVTGLKKISSADGDMYTPQQNPSGPLPGLGGAGYTPPPPAKPTSTPKKKVGAKIGAAFNKVKDSGVLQKAADLFLTPNAQTNAGATYNIPSGKGTNAGIKKTKPTGLSLGAKIGIGVVVVVVVGTIIYFATKKK